MAILEQWSMFMSTDTKVAVDGLVYDDKRYVPGQRLVTESIKNIYEDRMVTSSNDVFYFGNPHPLFLETHETSIDAGHSADVYFHLTKLQNF